MRKATKSFRMFLTLHEAEALDIQDRGGQSCLPSWGLWRRCAGLERTRIALSGCQATCGASCTPFLSLQLLYTVTVSDDWVATDGYHLDDTDTAADFAKNELVVRFRA
ncbi:hypothetical protein BDZ89DRAFT_1147505 [Hymenopellis radicata]|nr:hypothetical protein BDZ89DRAFT_1147505 [Hymenopellis radicata]